MSVNEGRVIDIHAVINILFDQATSKDPDEPVISLVAITAAYMQSGAVYPDTPLNDLKDDLVVTAVYSDESTETLQASDYTLSGTLTVGTSTVTVTYEGKTDTFSVEVSAIRTPVYELSNTPVIIASSNDCINTNYYLMKEDISFTLIVSVKIGDLTGISAPTLFHCLNESGAPYQGLSFFKNTSGYFVLAGQAAAATELLNYPTIENTEMKIVVRHIKETVNYSLDGSVNGIRQTQVISTRGKNPYLVNQPLWIGRNRTNTAKLFKGTIYNFIIFDDYLSDDEIVAYL